MVSQTVLLLYIQKQKGVFQNSLNVVRDKAGNIEKLVSVDKGELEQFVK